MVVEVLFQKHWSAFSPEINFDCTIFFLFCVLLEMLWGGGVRGEVDYFNNSCCIHKVYGRTPFYFPKCVNMPSSDNQNAWLRVQRAFEP